MSHGDQIRRQLDRERSARQAALGKRAKAIVEGKLGPVLRRWINADVVPIAALMRDVAGCYLVGDMPGLCALLDTPTAELGGEERPLRPLMQWLLSGKSLGRGPEAKDSSHAEDLALAFMAAAVTRCASGDEAPTLASLLANAADVLRDTVQGQFISGIQGAGAMQRVREHHPEHWKQRKSLNRICVRLHAQVWPQLRDEAEGRVELQTQGHRKVLTVLDYAGELRELSLRPPSPEDWEVMSLCWRDEKDGGSHPYRSLWLALAGMFFAAAQRTGGWFTIATQRTRRAGHTRTTRHVVLSEDAKATIQRDVERWVEAGFWAQPMLVPPADGDYLTVKHRPVTGQRPPLGLLTEAGSASSWSSAIALSQTPWQVNPYCLKLLEEHPELWHPEDPFERIKVAEHRRLGTDTFYLPTCMDFRGRIYYRTPFVQPQSGDLGKGLLKWPSEVKWMDVREAEERERAIIMHLASLYGHGLDKAPYLERWTWFQGTSNPARSSSITLAEKPIQLRSQLALMEAGETDSIPVQLDGTCNGLQHLTALTRDEQAAPLVNLTPSTLSDPPSDLYGAVAQAVSFQMEGMYAGAEAGEDAWLLRMDKAGLLVSRNLTKAPVMVLPYGGTRDAVKRAVKEAVLKSISPYACLRIVGENDPILWRSVWHDHADYGAHRMRQLFEHPLFCSDCSALADVVWNSIAPAIPRAMAFMACLQEIGKWVGPRALAWQTPSTGSSTPESASALWVIQAKSKASRKQVTMRGFHLPDMVRRLTLMANLNEIDPQAHRRGIVANFIHSLDAAHLAASVALFRERGGGCVGSVHDCLLVRPSEAALMGRCLRDTFAAIHLADPLSLPVRVGTPGIDEVVWKEYLSWYDLAAEAGVTFPERGTWDPEEVKQSAWFFS